jgi:hypothetical protein
MTDIGKLCAGGGLIYHPLAPFRAAPTQTI